MGDLNAEAFAHRLKARSCELLEWLEADAVGKYHEAFNVGGEDSTVATNRRSKKKRRGGGGEWRAYCSSKLRDGVTDFHEIAIGYAARGDAERHARARDGAAAT
eukprot:3638213-Pyramimonas_sp.AAC.1